MNEMHVHMIML